MLAKWEENAFMLVILTKYSQNGAEIPDLGCIFDFWHGFSPHHMLVYNASSFANGVDSPPIVVQWEGGESMPKVENTT